MQQYVDEGQQHAIVFIIIITTIPHQPQEQYKRITMNYNINIIRSNRKTVSLEVKEPGTLIVRVPLRISDASIRRILIEKESWINRHVWLSKKEEKDDQGITASELNSLIMEAKQKIPVMVEKYAAKMQVDYGRVSIKHQKTRWGSCSNKGNLNFNCLLMLAPVEVQEYVVVHELAHRIEMNHSVRFWRIVEEHFPNFKQARKWLKENGSDLIRKLY